MVLADLAGGNGSGAVAVGLLDASSDRDRLASGLGGQMFAGRLPSGGFAGRLFHPSHDFDG